MNTAKSSRSESTTYDPMSVAHANHWAIPMHWVHLWECISYIKWIEVVSGWYIFIPFEKRNITNAIVPMTLQHQTQTQRLSFVDYSPWKLHNWQLQFTSKCWFRYEYLVKSFMFLNHHKECLLQSKCLLLYLNGQRLLISFK